MGRRFLSATTHPAPALRSPVRSPPYERIFLPRTSTTWHRPYGHICSMADETPQKRDSQILDAGPRGASNMEAMSALSTGKKGTLAFFKGDESGTAIGSHKVFDFDGVQQHVGMVQTWNQCEQMLLTTEDKRNAVLLMDTETGA